MLPWPVLPHVSCWLPSPPVLPSSRVGVGASMRSGSVECVGIPPVRRSSSRSPSYRLLPPASPLTSAHAPMTWLTSCASRPSATTGWGSGTTDSGVGSESGDAIFVPYRAPKPTSLFLPSPMRGSLRLDIHCSKPSTPRRSKCSRAGIRLRAPGIHPFASGRGCLVTPGSATPPRRASSKKVCRPSTTWDRPTPCVCCARF
jgi:hypothetical protein